MGNAVSQFSSPLSSEDDDGLSLTSTMTQTFGRNGRRRDTNWNESVSRWVDTCQEELFNPRHAFGNAYARYVWCHLHTTALPDSQRTQTGYPESPWFQVDFHGKSLATMDPLPKIILTLHKSNSNGGVSTLQKSIFFCVENCTTCLEHCNVDNAGGPVVPVVPAFFVGRCMALPIAVLEDMWWRSWETKDFPGVKSVPYGRIGVDCCESPETSQMFCKIPPNNCSCDAKSWIITLDELTESHGIQSVHWQPSLPSLI